MFTWPLPPPPHYLFSVCVTAAWVCSCSATNLKSGFREFSPSNLSFHYDSKYISYINDNFLIIFCNDNSSGNFKICRPSISVKSVHWRFIALWMLTDFLRKPVSKYFSYRRCVTFKILSSYNSVVTFSNDRQWWPYNLSSIIIIIVALYNCCPVQFFRSVYWLCTATPLIVFVG